MPSRRQALGVARDNSRLFDRLTLTNPWSTLPCPRLRPISSQQPLWFSGSSTLIRSVCRRFSWLAAQPAISSADAGFSFWGLSSLPLRRCGPGSHAIQGVGAALLVPCCLALIGANFDEAERGKAIGTWAGSSAVATAIAPLLGGWMVDHFSWRWIFLINPLIALPTVWIA